MRGKMRANRWAVRARLTAIGLCLLVAISSPALGYDFYKYGCGRNDQAGRYDLAGVLWPNQANVVYDFGKIGNPAGLPASLTPEVVGQALVNASNEWEKWANVKFDDAVGDAGTGLVRVNYNPSGSAGAATWGYQHPHDGKTNNYAEIVFGPTAGGGAAWNAANFQWVMMHELGHVLGMDDLYLTYTEEFVDHTVPPNSNPQRELTALVDNVMYQYRYDGNDYSKAPQTIIDNDEIAGVIWLWGGKYNQITTADLMDSWNASLGRGSDFAHGDQPSNPLTWWDYRTTIVTAGTGKPYIDLEFAGYETFLGHALSPDGHAVSVIYGGNQGGDIERFIVDEVGWVGNVDLWVKSSYSREKRIWSNVVGGRTDTFDLPRVEKGLGFDGSSHWVKPFGPLPEPGALALLALGAIALIRRRR
jgi:MYXO-CTERM domain-containing protein